jgi:hypothetical protein
LDCKIYSAPGSAGFLLKKRERKIGESNKQLLSDGNVYLNAVNSPLNEEKESCFIDESLNFYGVLFNGKIDALTSID